MQDGIWKIRARLRNWGNWVNHDADIGPKGAVCISIESRHIPELGDVCSDPEPLQPTPDVPDAEALNLLIRELDQVQQYALAVTYGGLPCVFRYRRVGDSVMQRSLEMAELLLYEMARKRA